MSDTLRVRHPERHRSERIGWLRAAAGAALPMLTAMWAPPARLGVAVSGVSLFCLAALGTIAARTGGASAWKGAARVAFWGALAMAATAAVGSLFGTTVS